MSSFWSVYVIVIVVINIVGCVALLYFTRSKEQSAEDGKTTGHVYDGIEEYDNPLPRWWLYMFYITIVFSVIYLVLYPGLGNFKGTLGWTQVNQYNEEVANADAKYLPLFERYASMSIEDLQNEPEALQMGQSIFANTCFGCHGADGRGALGFPNLVDNDWLYGGSPEQIKSSILKGRVGIMPGWEASLGKQGVQHVVHYLLSKNEVERNFDEALAQAGEKRYQQFCLACHGADLKGNPALGAPDLSDGIWLHGGSFGLISDIVANGVQGNMPGHETILGHDKAHLVTAYVYSLSAYERKHSKKGASKPDSKSDSKPAQQPVSKKTEPEATQESASDSADPMVAYTTMDLDTLSQDAEAMKLAEEEFKKTCAVCHGADGKGLPTFPNLVDDDWQYGNSAEQILTSVLNGRTGVMPPWGAVLGEQGATEVAHYVLSKNQESLSFDQALASAGEARYQQVCLSCHGADLEGNQMLGAPNLKDDIWRHGNTVADLERAILQGVQGVMPAHKDLIGEAKSRLTAAYVYKLSKGL